MTVTVDGARLAPVRFTKGDFEETFAFALPQGSLGKSEIEVAVEAGATAASAIGEVVAVHVIPRPHDDLFTLGKFLSGKAAPSK